MKHSTFIALIMATVLLPLAGLLAVVGQSPVAAASAVTPIGTARAAGAGWSGSLQGSVTVPPGVYRNNAFAIQDATGGLYIYVASGSIPAMALGDVAQVTGTLKNYNGLLEMDPTNAIARIGSGSVPAPQVISTSTTIVSATQGMLVQVSGTATWSTAQTLGADWSFTLNDGSGPIQVFIDKDTGIDLRSYTSGVKMIVTGFSGNYNGAQIMPRYQTDVVVIDLTPPTVSAVNPINGATNVNLYKPLTAIFSEPISPTTINSATFTLIDAAASATGAIGYDDAARAATFTPTIPLAVSTRYTATLGTGITDRAGNALAALYTWSFTTGATDTYPPFAVSKSPAAGALNVPLNSAIVITFNEELKTSTVIPANFALVGPQGAVGWGAITYAAATYRVTLLPQGLQPNAAYNFTIGAGVADWAGNAVNPATRSWSFTTQAEPAMQVYHGDIHNHTSYSDGSLTPVDALAKGQAAGFDFMAITDHSYAISDAEWADTLSAVNAATVDGQFVALRGAEYTQGAEGHINVYNTVRHPCRTNSGVGSLCDYTPNLEKGVTVDGFYNWLSMAGTVGLDGAGTLAQFNHPGWMNFNDWTYHPEVSPTMRLEEVGNGNGTSYAFSEDEYIRSLDYGWKVGATNNADTHSPFWGTNTDHRTGVWLAGLAKADLLEALRARRTFATEDKNYALYLKGNGTWMGSEIVTTQASFPHALGGNPEADQRDLSMVSLDARQKHSGMTVEQLPGIANTGSIAFEIYGSDPDGESGATVQLITFGGAIVTQTTAASASFTWQPIVPVTPGARYFYVKVTQADGDRIVSSPVWTQGEANLSLTDLTVEPAIASTYNPSLITARVTNRMAQTQTVTVTFQIDGAAYQSITATAPACVKGPCVDGYANVAWQPTMTGSVTITALITGAPAGDNLDDNTRSTVMRVTDQKVPLILIDASHGNVNAGGREMRMFTQDLSDHGYNVLKNLSPLTAAALNTETVKLLLVTASQTAYTDGELNAIADYAATGGSLWLCGLADYTSRGANPWAASVADRGNAILERIEMRTGAPINMRLNDDEVIDGDDNNGYVFGVQWGDFPGSSATGIGVNVESLASWSLSSIRGRSVTQPITSGTPGAQIVAQGDLDAGYTTDSYHNPYHTSNTDADGENDAYIYNPTWVYPAAQPVGAIPLPMAAAAQLPNGGGRLLLYGDSNDAFTTFAYTAGDGKQNELFNLEAVMWLLGTPVTRTTIAEARAYATVNQPDKLDQLVWVEGKITAAYGEFFNVLYVEDETGGITVHAPAGDIDAAQYARGASVRALGTIGIYEGDTEIEFFEAEQVQVITPTDGIDPLPKPLTTAQTALEQNQGWLAQITGTVTATGPEYAIVDDGSGPVRAFLDGYNGVWDPVRVLDVISVKGLVSEDGSGPRLRVRNYDMRAGVPGDVKIITPARLVFLPLLRK